jgi:tetratricopeptide (TPR) repeat protein
MTYVQAPRERTALLHVGGANRVRLWLNGELVHQTTTAMSTPARWGLDRVPVTLRAGRNTLLAKVNRATGTYQFLHLRIADDPLDRGDTLAELGLWPEAATLYKNELAQGRRSDLEYSRRLATLLLAAGDREGYRRARDAMFELFGATTVPGNAETVAYICHLRPEPVADPARLLQLAEMGMKQNNAEGSEEWRRCAAGLASYRAGQFDKAIERLAAPPNRNELPQAWTVVAMAHHRLGHAAEARIFLAKASQWYDRVTRESLRSVPFRLPELPDWWDLADFQVLHQEAKALIEGEAPEDPNLTALQARARQELQSRDKATADCDHALMVSPDETRLLVARAHRLGDLGRWEQAETDIGRAVALQPDDPKIRRERNRIFLARGRIDELAVEYAARLGRSKIGPKWDTERNKLALELAEWDPIFTRLTRERPDDPFLWIGRGRYYVLRNQWNEAAAAYARGIKAREPSIDWFEYAAVLCLAGDRAGYRDFVTWAAERAGASADPYTMFLLARMSGITADSPIAPARSLRWAEQAATLKEADLFKQALGLALQRAGRYQEAVLRLEEPGAVQTRNAMRPQNNLVLALAYFRLNDLERARRSLARALAAIPAQGTNTLPPDWVGVQLLGREAEALISGASEPAKTSGER